MPRTRATLEETPRPSVHLPVRWILAGILLLAAALRVVYVLQSQASPSFTQPSMDALYHLEWARLFARGESLQQWQPGPFFRAPLYPWFLGLLLKTFGENILLVRLVQAAIGTASVGLVYLVGARAFDRRTGLLGALFASVYWVVIYFEGELLLPVLEIFFDLLAIWFSLRIEERPSPGRAALAGAAWGLAAIVRPNVLVFAPIVLAWAFLRARREIPGRGFAASLAFLLALATPIAPITAYNRIVGKDWILISSQGGVNFWIGNNPKSDGATAIVPGTRADWWGGYHDSIRQAEEAEGRTLAASEVSRHFSRKAWAWIRSEPGAALAHALWKLRLFFTDYELSNNASERFFAFRFGPILRALPLGFAALAPLALLGFALSARRGRAILPLWGFLPVYTASVVAFFVCSRFRAPVLPVMAILAAHGCFELGAMVRDRRLLALAGAAAFLTAAVVLVERIPRAIDRSDSKGLWALGVAASQRGDLPGAVEHYRASIAANDRFSPSHQDLGIALRQLGKTDEAEASLRRAIGIDPGNVVAKASLFDLLLSTGRRQEAVAVAKEVVTLSPVYAPGRYDLGRVYFLEAEDLQRGGDDGAVRELLEKAIPEFLEGLRLAGDEETAFNCAFSAGTAQAKLGRNDQAVLAFQRALAARPSPPPVRAGLQDAAVWWWRCQSGLIEALSATGRGAEARSRAADLIHRFPDDPRAKSLGRALGN